ncbi:hypothetical protein JCM33774_27610 [Actinophytocola sp. KF-1]
MNNAVWIGAGIREPGGMAVTCVDSSVAMSKVYGPESVRHKVIPLRCKCRASDPAQLPGSGFVPVYSTDNGVVRIRASEWNAHVRGACTRRDRVGVVDVAW